jgi:hypothetical protein
MTTKTTQPETPSVPAEVGAPRNRWTARWRNKDKCAICGQPQFWFGLFNMYDEREPSLRHVCWNCIKSGEAAFAEIIEARINKTETDLRERQAKEWERFKMDALGLRTLAKRKWLLPPLDYVQEAAAEAAAHYQIRFD